MKSVITGETKFACLARFLGSKCLGQCFRSDKLQNESFPNFSNFRPEFCPEFCSEFSRIFGGFFVLRFVGDGDQKKITKNKPPFFNAKFPGKQEKIFTKFFWRAGRVTVFHALQMGRPPYKSANPQKSQKCSGECSRRCWPQKGVLGEVLGKVLASCVSSGNKEDKHFPEHFPEHPVSGRHLSEHSPMPNMTGRPGYRTMEVIAGSSASYLARTPCAPLFSTWFNRGGNRKAFRLQGKGGDHFHCAVEPSPGHIRWRTLPSTFGGRVLHFCRGPPPS